MEGSTSMCVSMAPAEFNGAIAYGGEVTAQRHVLGYQNSAQSLSGPNCMLLHIPTDEALTAENLISTQHAPNIMKNIGNAVPSLFPVFRSGLRDGGAAAPVHVRYGAYEIILANSASDIPAALELVSPAKRPVINQELVAWYDLLFSDYSFVLACFNNAVEVVNHPILLSYKPSNPDRIFVPGLESHDGRPPLFNMRDDAHPRDFKVAFGSRLRPEPSQDDVVAYYKSGLVRYSEPLGMLTDVLPSRIVGFRDLNVGVNGDYWAKAQDVRDGVSGEKLLESMANHYVGSVLE